MVSRLSCGLNTCDILPDDAVITEDAVFDEDMLNLTVRLVAPIFCSVALSAVEASSGRVL